MTIYKPSEDSDLLLKAIDNFKNQIVLEIGIGSGIIFESLYTNNNYVVGVDINPESLSSVTSSLQNIIFSNNLNLILGDGPSMFAPETFDLIIFNPPYLPHDDYTDLTTDGGNNGLEITNTWIQLSLTLIKKSGKILFLQSTLAPIHEYIDFLSKSTKVNIISKKKLFFEELYIIEVMHNE